LEIADAERVVVGGVEVDELSEQRQQPMRPETTSRRGSPSRNKRSAGPVGERARAPPRRDKVTCCRGSPARRYRRSAVGLCRHRPMQAPRSSSTQLSPEESKTSATTTCFVQLWSRESIATIRRRLVLKDLLRGGVVESWPAGINVGDRTAMSRGFSYLGKGLGVGLRWLIRTRFSVASRVPRRGRHRSYAPHSPP
jgi:hypothetical protein